MQPINFKALQEWQALMRPAEAAKFLAITAKAMRKIISSGEIAVISTTDSIKGDRIAPASMA